MEYIGIVLSLTKTTNLVTLLFIFTIAAPEELNEGRIFCTKGEFEDGGSFNLHMEIGANSQYEIHIANLTVTDQVYMILKYAEKKFADCKIVEARKVVCVSSGHFAYDEIYLYRQSKITNESEKIATYSNIEKHIDFFGCYGNHDIQELQLTPTVGSNRSVIATWTYNNWDFYYDQKTSNVLVNNETVSWPECGVCTCPCQQQKCSLVMGKEIEDDVCAFQLDNIEPCMEYFVCIETLYVEKNQKFVKCTTLSAECTEADHQNQRRYKSPLQNNAKKTPVLTQGEYATITVCVVSVCAIVAAIIFKVLKQRKKKQEQKKDEKHVQPGHPLIFNFQQELQVEKANERTFFTSIKSKNESERHQPLLSPRLSNGESPLGKSPNDSLGESPRGSRYTKIIIL